MGLRCVLAMLHAGLFFADVHVVTYVPKVVGMGMGHSPYSNCPQRGEPFSGTLNYRKPHLQY